MTTVETFLLANHIEFIDKGPNVAREHVNIQCPFCGEADPSHHMGIELVTGRWGCWRNRLHRGGSFHKLVAALLRIPDKEARAMVADDSKPPPQSIGDLRQRLGRLNAKPEKVAKPERVEYLPEFKPIRNSLARKHLEAYLQKRKIPAKRVERFCSYYDLRFAMFGQFARRIIFPITDTRNVLRGWQGRHTGKHFLRYKAFPFGRQPKQFLVNGGRAAKGGKVLVIVEGPVDCFKLDYFGMSRGVRAVAIMSTSATPEQVEQILLLTKRFDRVVIMLDRGALGQSLLLRQALPGSGFLDFARFGKKDVGEMNVREIRRVVKTLANSR